MECIGKGKAQRPYEFGVNVSVATTLARAKAGSSSPMSRPLPGNPYDGHTLATVIPEMEALIGTSSSVSSLTKATAATIVRSNYKFRVFTSGQKRRMTPKIKRELRRRSAIEPVIGHLKSDHRMGRNYLLAPQGLAAAGYSFRRLIRWLQLLLRQILLPLIVRLRLVSS